MSSLLVIATVAGLLAGGFVGAKVRSRRRALPDGAAPAPGSANPSTKDERLAYFPCALGDVILLSSGEEAWLAGALLLRERGFHRDARGDFERTIAALFVAPDRGKDRAIYAHPAPNASLDWMSLVAPDALVVGPEPPSAIEHDGERFERVRRIPLALSHVGEGAPDLGAEGIVGEYEGGAGARLLVIVGTRATHVWRGRQLEAGMYDVLPGGAATLYGSRAQRMPSSSSSS